jgi:predicted amidohydrolase
VKIGFLQLRPQFGKIRENVRAARSMMSNVSDALIVLPELFNTGYLFRNQAEVKKLSESVATGYTVGEMKKLAKNQNLTLVFGMAEAKSRQYFNSSVMITPAGKVFAYQKAHLFDREKLFFKPGTKLFTPVKVGDMTVGQMVCFDWFYPEVMRHLAVCGAQVVAHPSNLVLPWAQEGMKIRSLENRVFSITANRIGTEKSGPVSLTFTGRSQIMSPSGEVLTSAGERSETLKVVEVDPAEALDKHVTPQNDVFADRRVALYKSLLRKVS